MSPPPPSMLVRHLNRRRDSLADLCMGWINRSGMRNGRNTARPSNAARCVVRVNPQRMIRVVRPLNLDPESVRLREALGVHSLNQLAEIRSLTVECFGQSLPLLARQIVAVHPSNIFYLAVAGIVR